MGHRLSFRVLAYVQIMDVLGEQVPNGRRPWSRYDSKALKVIKMLKVLKVTKLPGG